MMRWALGTALGAVMIGLALRFEFVTGTLGRLVMQFGHVRHAHSHLGFWGVMTLAWWLVASRHTTLFSPRAVNVQAVTTIVCISLFTVMGYRPPTMALSTVLAGFWLTAAWRQWRAHLPASWLDVTPFAMAVATLIVPAIAITARSNPGLSRGLAHVFIGMLVLGAFIPVAWAAIGLPRRQPALVYLAAAAAQAAGMAFHGVLGHAVALVGALYAVAVAQAVGGMRGPVHLRLVWWSIPLMLAGWTVVPELRGEIWRVAGIHHVVLAALLPSLHHGLRPALPRPLGVAYHVTLWPMLGTIVAPALFPASFWPLAAALAGAAFVLVLVVIIVPELLRLRAVAPLAQVASRAR